MTSQLDIVNRVGTASARCILLFFILLSLILMRAQIATAGTTIAATRSLEPIKFNGTLNESLWSKAQRVELTQQSPSPGGKTPYTTEVRVLLADNKLYFGFICADPEPQKIGTHTLKRDGDLSGDDSVSIVLDSYGDKRTGYF